MHRTFKADRPDQLWVSDYTFVSTWQGFAYVAFIIDVYARRIVGWKLSSSQQTQFVLDALEQALHARRPGDALVDHSDRGSQYVSIRYTERLAEAGIEPSVGSVGDSYDNALAETINGLYKAEVVHRRSWRSREELELATLRWVDWYNTGDYSDRSATSYPPKPKRTTINSDSTSRRRDSRQRASGNPGAIQAYATPGQRNCGQDRRASALGRTPRRIVRTATIRKSHPRLLRNSFAITRMRGRT